MIKVFETGRVKKGNSISQPGLCTWALPRKCPWISPQDVQLDIAWYQCQIFCSWTTQSDLRRDAMAWPEPSNQASISSFSSHQEQTEPLSWWHIALNNRGSSLLWNLRKWRWSQSFSCELYIMKLCPQQRQQVQRVLWSPDMVSQWMKRLAALRPSTINSTGAPCELQRQTHLCVHCQFLATPWAQLTWVR